MTRCLWKRTTSSTRTATHACADKERKIAPSLRSIDFDIGSGLDSSTIRP